MQDQVETEKPLYLMILESQEDLLAELRKKGIDHHTSINDEDLGSLNYLSLLAYFENENRGTLSKENEDLRQFEKRYFDHEVGNMRRYFNRKMESEINYELPLLDYGGGGRIAIGGDFVKEVYAVEVDYHWADSIFQCNWIYTKFSSYFSPKGMLEVVASRRKIDLGAS